MFRFAISIAIAIAIKFDYNLNNVLRHVRIESGSRFVAKHQRRIGENFGSESQTLALAAGYAFDASGSIADDGIGTLGQT